MGLDAAVRCRCWEDGRCAPPPPGLIPTWVDDEQLTPSPLRDGELSSVWDDVIAMDRWAHSCCEHEEMQYKERIGNAALWGELASVIEKLGPTKLPVLIRDFPETNAGKLSAVDAPAAKLELQLIRASGQPEVNEVVREALDAMDRLLDASVRTGNPIIWC